MNGLADETPTRDRPRLQGLGSRRRVARLFLLGTLLFIVVYASHVAPSEQTLEFRFRGSSRPGSLTATWTPEGESEPVGGVSLHFPKGVPARVAHRVSLPNGPYVITAKLEPFAPNDGARATMESRARRAASERSSSQAEPPQPAQARDTPPLHDAPMPDASSAGASGALQTNYSERVTLAGGPTIIHLEGS